MHSPGVDLIHVWSRCHACGTAPILGMRFECQTCPTGPDSDLCQACYLLLEQGQIKHPPPEAREAPRGPHLFRPFEGARRERLQHWLAVPASAATPPKVPDRFVVRPEFRSGRESFFGSYAFIVVAEDGRDPLLLTALHILDELARFRGIDCSDNNAAYTGRELPPHVTSVQLYDPFAPNWMLAELGTARGMLPIPHARIGAVEPYSQGDIAAFRLAPFAPFLPSPLALTNPVVGEPIWLAVNPGPGIRNRTTQAVVVEITDETFVFRFAPPAELPRYTSGAPLLNRSGEVVGVNAGMGTLDNQKFGHGVHVASIRRHLGRQ